jgi:hypothetical protein
MRLPRPKPRPAKALPLATHPAHDCVAPVARVQHAAEVFTVARLRAAGGQRAARPESWRCNQRAIGNTGRSRGWNSLTARVSSWADSRSSHGAISPAQENTGSMHRTTCVRAGLRRP